MPLISAVELLKIAKKHLCHGLWYPNSIGADDNIFRHNTRLQFCSLHRNPLKIIYFETSFETNFFTLRESIKGDTHLPVDKAADNSWGSPFGSRDRSSKQYQCNKD